MSELQIALKIQKGIRDYEDSLVQKIENAFQKERGKLDSSQYQNLVQVALSTESPEVIKNFLRYQVGRDNKWGRGKGSLAEAIIDDIQGNSEKQSSEVTSQKNHQVSSENESDLDQLSLVDMTEKIIDKIKRDLEQQSNEIAEEAKKATTKDLQKNLEKKSQSLAEASKNLPQKKKKIHMELIRRYLGYGKRHLIYLKAQEQINSKQR